MAKYSAFGTLLKIGDGAPTEVFTTVGGVMDISGPSYTTETIDVTAHDSPNAFEELVVGLRRSGEITFDVALDPGDNTHDDSTGLIAFNQDREIHSFQLVMPDADTTTMSFDGYVTGIDFGFPVNGAMTASITVKPTGEITLA